MSCQWHLPQGACPTAVNGDCGTLPPSTTLRKTGKMWCPCNQPLLSLGLLMYRGFQGNTGCSEGLIEANMNGHGAPVPLGSSWRGGPMLQTGPCSQPGAEHRKLQATNLKASLCLPSWHAPTFYRYAPQTWCLGRGMVIPI